MKPKNKYLVFIFACLFFLDSQTAMSESTSLQVISALLNRIGGEGAADLIVTVLDESLGSDNEEVFIITANGEKPCVKGSNLPALTTGIGWYLNHYAHVNLAWNNLTTDLSSVPLPIPTTDEVHSCTTPYRYYLNYCTFSYSMSTWTWERWEQEIDWMALHGINMPLQIVGLDVVWKNLLTQDLGYTPDEANNFIAGPCFQAWWGMNNLEGLGGENADWWYERQATLTQKILKRERELGMEPVLPGYSGMVPSSIVDHGYKATSQGSWNDLQRPYILDPNSEDFAEISANYYTRLTELMGTAAYYSIDPFHEGANTSGIDVASAYKAIGEAMLSANEDAKWVIQFWQWSRDQYKVLKQVDHGKLIVLDLFSDAHTHFDKYKGHDAVYCMLNNFGARTGFYGRLTKMMSEFFNERKKHTNIKGIGATPEGIEQTPILYDALYELPWHAAPPNAAKWVADYTVCRYGTESQAAQKAWEFLRNSSLNCNSPLQGPVEAVVCARPALSIDAVSSWGCTKIYYDELAVVRAAHLLLHAGLSGKNYSYDLTDISRQALTDYAYFLLKAIQEADAEGESETFESQRDTFLQLILDLDELLCTNEHFMLGKWTSMARAIADEKTPTAKPDSAANWLELSNARTLITTWGGFTTSERGGLRDYSYREWGGMLKDFYYNRWKLFFEAKANGLPTPHWFAHDWEWAHNHDFSYGAAPCGETATVVTKLFERYFIPLDLGEETFFIYRKLHTDKSNEISIEATRGETFIAPVFLPGDVTAEIGIDFDKNGTIESGERASGLEMRVPTKSKTGKVAAMLSLSDGTKFTFSLVLKNKTTKP